MAGRFRGLFKVFRGKRGPGAAPAQQPEEVEQFQPRQDDAALDRTQEQDRAHGRFRRTVQMFRKFIRIWHGKTSTTATEGTAEPDSGLTELQAEPDVSTDSPECSEDSDSPMNDHTAKTDVAVTEDMAVTKDMAVTEDMVITNTDTRETQGIPNTDTMPIPTGIHAPKLDFFEESAASPQQQVPAMVRNIHQRLGSHVTVDAWLQIDILRLAEEHPADVVLTLLRCAPSCDRAATMMWRIIGSLGPAVEKVLPTLLCVMQEWPLHSMSTSDGDDTDVFALAATLALWVIVQVPECHEAMILYSARLFVTLLFQVVITTQQVPEEVDHFWRACWEEHHLPTNPNRFAVQAMKALLCRLRCDNEVVAMERKRGWDTLLCADTQHYAVGLLAREMRQVLIPFCSRIAFHLLKPLSREEPCWDLPFLAFLVELLECLDLSKYGDSILETMSRYLLSECRQRCRLALRGLVVLSKDPAMARRMGSLSQRLVELLGDADGEVVRMSLSVFMNVLENKDILVSSTTALKLAEALLPLLDNDNSHVQILSIHLFCKVMELVVDEGKKPLKTIVCQSLLPLLFHCHDENRNVADASREMLICAAKFLKRRNLGQLVKKEQLSKFAECLLAEDRSRAAERLHQALPFVESPQESLREAAVRFMGAARVFLRGHKEELQLLSEALQALRRDDSPSPINIIVQEIFNERAAELRSSAGSEPVSL
ncbi:maestro heat-like repeat-containing protein family member 1 [Corvus moneduloides]|uniref:maestro heat-like repeat-containing protein family member 1 n=1 Tax=Corvus moneduloides TaxID=1196302 RepID=UPI001362C5D2|nr:maestro heat-like repeat-containing protein family member 1 [Corvus moneduloides]